MVLATEVDSVHIHTTIVSPVVGKRYNELDAGLGGSIYDFVKRGDIDGGCAVGKSLEDNLSRTSSLATVLRQAIGIIGLIFVVETPCSEDFETSVLGSGQALFDIFLSLNLQLAGICLISGKALTPLNGK